MKILSIENTAIEIPLKKDFGASTYHVTSRCTVITHIHTDEGIVGQVYNGDNRDEGHEIVQIVQEELAPLVVGEDPARIEYLWQKMMTVSLHLRKNRSAAMEAIACVDSALWDLKGKACNSSVNRLLGGFRDSIPLISIGGYYEDGKTLADLSQEMEDLRAVGMAGCKVKVGGLSAKDDAERVAAARKGGGDDFIIVVDANRGWDADMAIDFSRRIEHLNIGWFEEPCHWYDDAAQMARVRNATTIPVNAGQSEVSSHGVKRLLEAGAVDFVNLDASECGGITEWYKAAAMCAVHGVKMAHHEEPQISLQMLTGVANGSYVECFAHPLRDPVWPGMLVNPPVVKSGIIEVPTAPGLGLEFDEEMVARYQTLTARS